MKNHLVCIPTRKSFSKIQGNAKFIETLKQFEISKFTITFKTNFVKLIDKHPEVKNFSLFYIF